MSTPTNSMIELMHRHGSVRHYRPDPVPRKLVETVVAAGQRAPTSSNLQMYSVVATTDAAKRQRLFELCSEQKFIRQAPVFLTWCADLSRLARVCAHQGYSIETREVEKLLLAVVDTSLAMQNAALAAESLGLGFCYVGAIRNQPRQVSELLGLPPLVFPLVGMALGWPEKPPRWRPRLPLEAVLHWEQYDPDDEAALRAYDREMIATGIYRGRRVAAAQETSPDAYGWMEHSARRVSQKQRLHLRRDLLTAGFGFEGE